MRVRLFIEVELSDKTLLEAFGDQLPALTAAHEIEAGVARSTEAIVSSIPGVNQVRALFLPDLMADAPEKRIIT